MTTAPGAARGPDITAICARFGNDRHRMLDILLGVQAAQAWISPPRWRRSPRQPA